MLPEVAALNRAGSLVRIPPADDVPVTGRIRRILDAPQLRRLASISQLGMVGLVYPGATHSRLEHTLGVYHNALRLLARFADDPVFLERIDPALAEAFVVASLLHDIGHWPFCHPIEDMQLPDLQKHESRIGDLVAGSELAVAIDQDWSCSVESVIALLHPKGSSPSPNQPGYRFLESCLSGPIDIDKLDYLQRDSLHAGVPYGRNFDVGRLISSMRLNPENNRLAIGEKGRTAAEMMVFARYVMFSEVYWHHAVRSATAMLQRCVFLLQHRIDLGNTLQMSDTEWISRLRRTAEGSIAEPLVEGLFGPRRRLYKRVVEYNVIDGTEVHRLLARKPYWWLVACAERLADRIARRSGVAIHSADILIDAPPVKLEVDINMDVVGRDGTLRTLGDVSPVASALAQRQFDDQVKRVRVFVRPDLRAPLQQKLSSQHWHEEMIAASEALDQEIA